MAQAKTRGSTPALLFAVLVPIGFGLLLVLPASREAFLAATAAHPYLMGFVKFALLATAGEVLAGKIAGGAFRFSAGMPAKAAVWGLIGMMMALLMPVYSGGVLAAQQAGVLPGAGSAVPTAIFTSAIMNLTFGIAMMAFHRVTDTLVEMRCAGGRLSLVEAVARIDWVGFVGFVVCRTLPLFWIPAHAVTFSIPGQFRVFLSAFLSIVLGLILAIAKKRGAKPAQKPGDPA